MQSNVAAFRPDVLRADCGEHQPRRAALIAAPASICSIIPYKGTAGALQDTVGGRINAMFDVLSPLMSQGRSGNAETIVVTAKETGRHFC